MMQSLRLVLTFCAAACLLAGCTSDSKPGPAATQTTSSVTPQNSGTAAPSGTKEPAQKFLGKIPYDVWFDDPLSIANDQTTVGSPTAVAVNPSNSSPSPSPSQNPPTNTAPSENPPAAKSTESSPPTNAIAAGATPESGIPADILIEETKQLRVRLQTNLKTIAVYNRAVLSVANDGLILAVLADLASRKPDVKVSWQSKAAALRDLGIDIAQQASGTGAKPYGAAKKGFEAALVVLDGGNPPDGAPKTTSIPEFADRGALMYRIKISSEWLKSEINTKERLTQMKSDAVREATILATLGAIVSSPEYDFAKEDAYKQYIQEFIEGNRSMTTAAESGDYSQFQEGLNKVTKSCGVCHQKYAGGE